MNRRMAARKLRAVVIRQLIREGWNPPAPTREQALRILEDIADLTVTQRLDLTEREARVLGLVAEGHTKEQIARKIDRSPETVKDIETRVRRKLGARNNAHAVHLMHLDDAA